MPKDAIAGRAGMPNRFGLIEEGEFCPSGSVLANGRSSI